MHCYHRLKWNLNLKFGACTWLHTAHFARCTYKIHRGIWNACTCNCFNVPAKNGKRRQSVWSDVSMAMGGSWSCRLPTHTDKVSIIFEHILQVPRMGWMGWGLFPPPSSLPPRSSSTEISDGGLGSLLCHPFQTYPVAKLRLLAAYPSVDVVKVSACSRATVSCSSVMSMPTTFPALKFGTNKRERKQQQNEAASVSDELYIGRNIYKHRLGRCRWCSRCAGNSAIVN